MYSHLNKWLQDSNHLFSHLFSHLYLHMNSELSSQLENGLLKSQLESTLQKEPCKASWKDLLRCSQPHSLLCPCFPKCTK